MLSGAPLLALSLLVALEPVLVDTADLYGHRLLLGRDGSPRVALGVDSGRDSVTLESGAGLRLTGRRAAGQEAVSVDLPPRARFLRTGGREARQRYAVAVAALEGAERSQRHDEVARWRARGERASARDVGLVFGLSGVLIDNRATLVLVRNGASRHQAEQAARELHDRDGVATSVVPLVQTLPELQLEVRAGESTLRFIGTINVVARDGGEISVDGISEGPKKKIGSRTYPGAIALAPDASGRIAVVNLTAVDEILKGVVPSEMFGSAPLEALKAQAVTARGAVFAKLGRRHFADPYVLCNTEHCQVYGGSRAHHPAASRAVDETRGELMFLAGQLVDSVYSSTCGGHTEDAEVAWDMPPKGALRGRRDGPSAADDLARRVAPFEDGVGDASLDGEATDLSNEQHLRQFLAEPPTSYCARSTRVRADKLRWTRRIASDEMDRLLFKYGVGHVQAIEVQGRGVSGRVRGVRIVGDQQRVVIQREWPVRQALGLLNSGAFVVDEERDAKGVLTAFLFRGMGWGHGVGMCQIGAIGMAEAGQNYRAILEHYYNGAQVRSLY
ncbi:MAG: SpoIID/LytB domain-containing protein [Pseudomonadota bacterium]